MDLKGDETGLANAPIPGARGGLPVRRKRFALLALVAAVVVFLPAASYLGRVRLLSGLAYVLTLDTVGPSADYIVPLGGGADSRPFVAAALYRNSVAPNVLLFEYDTSEAIRMGIAISGTELYGRVLEIEGVPRSAIRIIPGAVHDTWEEALAIRRVLPAGRPVRLVVVTSPEHTRRTLWAFRKVFAGMAVDVRMAPARHLRFDEKNWWRDEEGVLAYLHEYLKLPYYWVRYNFHR